MNEVVTICTKSGAGLETSPAPLAVVEALGDILSEGVDVHRCLAAKALGRIRAGQAAGPLIKALLDEDEDVRTDAAEALAKIGDPAASDQLYENLIGDPCTEVKLFAIAALVKTGDSRIAPWLVRMVKGRDEEITWDEQEFYSSGWDDWVDIQAGAIAGLADLRIDSAVPDIVAALKDEEAQDIAETVFKALTRIGPAGIDALGEYLKDPQSRTRRRAATAVAGACSQEARDLYPYAFSDPSPDVRLAALRARAAVDPQDVWLAVMLEDNDEDVRAETVKLLGRLYPVELVPLLDDPSPKVVALAMTALGEAEGGGDIAPKVTELTGSAVTEVAAAACAALGKIVPDSAADMLEKALTDRDLDCAVRLGALKGLCSAAGNRTTATLISVIDDPERQVRLENMVALAGIARREPEWPNAAADALLLAMQGAYAPEPEEPAEVAEPAQPETDADAAECEEEPAETPKDDAAQVTSTLDSILQDGPAIKPFVGLPEQGIDLSAEDMERLAIARRVVGKRKMPKTPDIVLHEDVQRFAARVLSELDHPDATRALAAALETDDAETVATAADSLARIADRLGQIPGDVETAIIAALAQVPIPGKLPLIRTLGTSGGDDAKDLLLCLTADEDGFVRNEAIRALSAAEPGSARFAELLGDSDPSARLSAAEAVARSGSAQSLQLLADMAFSYEGYHGRQIARLLRDLDRDGANDEFLRVLADPERRRYWSVAIEALEVLNQQDEAA